MESKTARYYFDSLGAAADGLDTLLVVARETDGRFRFGGLSAQQILVSGLLIEGEIDDLTAKLDRVPGAVRYDE